MSEDRAVVFVVDDDEVDARVARLAVRAMKAGAVEFLSKPFDDQVRSPR